MTTWMLVEDEPDLHELLCYLIEGIGHQVLGFWDGEEALAWIEAADQGRAPGEYPELALIDLRLPGQAGGPEVAARLRRSPILQQTAIVLMTAYRLSAAEETCILAQADPDLLLYKPLPAFPEFRQKLEDLLM